MRVVALKNVFVIVAGVVVGVVVVIGGAACAAPPDRPVTENQQPIARLTLPDEARVGAPVQFAFDGTHDVDGALASLALETGDGSAPIALDPSAATAEHVFATPGLYVVALVATDDAGLAGRARAPLLVLPADPDAPEPEEPPPEEPPPEEVEPDADGDGLAIDVDPAPDAYNGLRLDVFAIDGIPRDLLARQKAEDVVDALDDAEPLGSLDVTSGWQTRAMSEDALAVVYDGAPDRAEQFALRFSGTLTPPDGAASLEVSVGADDLCVVLIDGVPVASADDEYALDFLRNDRVPAAAPPIALFGPVTLEIVLANDGGPYAWDVALRFLDDSGAIIDGAPTQASFLLP